MQRRHGRGMPRHAYPQQERKLAMTAELNIYTVNCGKKATVIGKPPSDRGATYHVFACQELQGGCREDGYDLIGVGGDPNYQLNVMLFLHRGGVGGNKRAKGEWRALQTAKLTMPSCKTYRAIVMAELGHESNKHCRVWIASMHCKSGQPFQRSAQKEL